MSAEYLKWIMPSITNRSVKKSDFRFEKAMEQANIALDMKKRGNLPEIDDIIACVNEFLESLKMKKVEPQKKKTRNVYSDIWNKNKTDGMAEKRDIVWIKLTQNGVVGVVGTSCDVFLDFPKEKAKYSTSDLIVEYIASKIGKGFNWDTENVLIFPLCNIPDGLNRSDIESGIGNYLIHKGIPILDYYSHNY